MREIEDAHEALNRVQRHVDRMRWIIQNPRLAEALIADAVRQYGDDNERGLAIIRKIDAVTHPLGVPLHREYDSRFRAERGWQCDNPVCDCYDTQRQKLHCGPKPMNENAARGARA